VIKEELDYKLDQLDEEDLLTVDRSEITVEYVNNPEAEPEVIDPMLRCHWGVTTIDLPLLLPVTSIAGSLVNALPVAVLDRPMAAAFMAATISTETLLE
jgi:hypothetical protein